MTRTFYIPKDEEKEMHDFVEYTESMNENYSNILMNFIKEFNKAKKEGKKDDPFLMRTLKNND